MTQEENKTLSFEAKTIEEAIQIALKKLNCSRDEIDVKVISEEKKGLFGMDGADPAKIIVRRK